MPERERICSYEQLFIGCRRWREPPADGVIEVISPHTEDPIAWVPAAAEADVDEAARAARQAFDASDSPRMPLKDRLEIVGRLAVEYQKHLDEFATLTAEQMG